MMTLLLAAWMSTSEAGTIYGIERSGGAFNWFAYDVDSGTRTVLAPFGGDVDPSRPGDLAWNTAAAELTYIPGGPLYRDMYTIERRTGEPMPGYRAGTDSSPARAKHIRPQRAEDAPFGDPTDVG